MAVTDSLFMNGASGAIGKQVVFRRVGNKTVISSFPDFSSRTLSPKQKRNLERMKKANLFAKTILANESKRNAALLRLQVTSNKLYTALIREYFKSEG
ncbi:MAG: hypothetical protein ABI415_06900 [Flavitalea sp.]